MPVGAYGGRREIMQQIAPAGPIYQAGTLTGNPVAMAAGLAMLELIQTPGFYDELDRRTRLLTDRAPGRGGRRSRRAVQHQSRLRHVRPVLHPGKSRDATRRRRRAIVADVQPLLPRHAEARRLSRAVGVRGGLRFDRAHRAGSSPTRWKQRVVRCAPREQVERKPSTCAPEGRSAWLARSLSPRRNCASAASRRAEAFGEVFVADVEGGHETQHVRTGLQHQQAVRRGMIEDGAGLALVRLVEHRADHQAATTNLLEQATDRRIRYAPGHRARPAIGAPRWPATPAKTACASATRATAAAIGLPPKVVPCAPNCITSATFGPASMAPMGKPQPKALASVTMSGLAPSCI